MIVAVVAVLMMQMTVNQIIYVVAMRDSFMTAAGAVLVLGIVPRIAVQFVATIRIHLGDFNIVFLNFATLLMTKMAFVQVVGMACMLDRSMAASGSMRMGVLRFVRHGNILLKGNNPASSISISPFSQCENVPACVQIEYLMVH